MLFCSKQALYNSPGNVQHSIVSSVHSCFPKFDIYSSGICLVVLTLLAVSHPVKL